MFHISFQRWMSIASRKSYLEELSRIAFLGNGNSENANRRCQKGATILSILPNSWYLHYSAYHWFSEICHGGFWGKVASVQPHKSDWFAATKSGRIIIARLQRVNPCHSEFLLNKVKLYLHFLSFLITEMVLAVLGTCLSSIKLVPLFLMPWWWNVPRLQQP